MIKWPDKNKIDYLFFHLGFLLEIPQELERNIHLIQDEVVEGGINFKVSERELDESIILFIDKVPVLYPLSGKKQFYTLTEGTLVFEHDILQSAFYLLSGLQEYRTHAHDHFNRFPHKNSIQHKLSVTGLPVVNYYFKAIAEGIEHWAAYHNYNFTRKEPLWKEFGLLVTHDVDVIDHYTAGYLVYKVKEILGMKGSNKARGRLLKEFRKGLSEWLKGRRGENPAWDFEELTTWEKALDYRSVFYFLDKDLKHQDSYYQLDDKRIVRLMSWLHENGHEIGLHGTCRSSHSIKAMKSIMDKLERVSPQSISGIRQHRLMYKNPETLKVQQEAGVLYDTSLGFAECEGFRNSYCLPFRLFDHDANRMSAIWEFPLTVMDVSLFNYQNYRYDEATISMENLMNEVVKFNGLFTLLWHNGFNNEFERPGVKSFYRQLLQELANKGAQSRTGKEILKDLQRVYAG